MKYDDATWHSGSEFPAGLPAEAGATHAGIFLAWALLAELGSDYHAVDSAEDLERLRARRLTPGQYFLTVCSGQLTDEDFNREGNDFAGSYYQQGDAGFIGDYQEYLAKGLPTEYHVGDTWTNFDKLKPVLDRRLANWRRGRAAPRPAPQPTPPRPLPQPPPRSPKAPPPVAPRPVQVRNADELPEDILQRISADFGSEVTPGVLSRLAGFIGQLADARGEPPDARILRCVVYIAAGDRKRLEEACRLALTDTRDVMYQAEYDAGDRQVRRLDQPFLQES